MKNARNANARKFGLTAMANAVTSVDFRSGKTGGVNEPAQPLNRKCITSPSLTT